LSLWLEDNAKFKIPSQDAHFLYDAFQAREAEDRITVDQFIETLSGPPQ
jgi:hypothetical protein